MDGRESLSVLIVEDADDSRELYAFVFEQAGFRTVCAESVAQAFDALREGSIDAVVTDYNLPDGNGVAMLEEASHAGLLASDVPAVLCTACSPFETPGGRFVATFLKPVDTETLVRVVQDAIAARQEDEAPTSREMAS